MHSRPVQAARVGHAARPSPTWHCAHPCRRPLPVQAARAGGTPGSGLAPAPSQGASRALACACIVLAASATSCPHRTRTHAASLYDALGVAANATKEELREAYRALAKRWHPDLFPESGKV